MHGHTRRRGLRACSGAHGGSKMADFGSWSKREYPLWFIIFGSGDGGKLVLEETELFVELF